MLFKKIVAPYCKNRIKHKNTICEKRAQIFLLNLLVHTITQRLQKVKRRYRIRNPIPL
jgi:hypothetical protein